MKIMNGFTIIASQPSRDDTFVVLGARLSAYSPSGFEYITARVTSLDDHQWFWGHYFTEFNDAVVDFNDRSYPELPSGRSTTATLTN